MASTSTAVGSRLAGRDVGAAARRRGLPVHARGLAHRRWSFKNTFANGLTGIRDGAGRPRRRARARR